MPPPWSNGSFYWHFKDRSALVETALAEWERRDTDQLIERASDIDTPRDRLLWLFRVVFSDTAGVGIAQLRRTTPALAPQGRSSNRYLTNITQWLID